MEKTMMFMTATFTFFLFIMVYGVVSFSKEVVYVTFSEANMYQAS